MNLSYLLMLVTLLLSLIHFIYGYIEAIRISNEDGPVNGWSVIFSFPLGFVFAYFATMFHQQILPH
ncbi:MULTISPECIES: hypothetical protein [Bacillaceae]|uniref:hypothetical protein n=1 Tax=Bacillaceae TaxID=186817 RepID=UPI000C75B638|nr:MULTISPECIES: hypothetical protein [Bacillaceae]PLR65967.1 hypothetical protein CYJ36_20030 [Bacillus sp. UMB0893]QNG60789.1 hypothetical protein H4O14_04570 [Bacillus sp. PAMC26568]